MQKGWVLIYSSSQLYNAEIVKSILLENNIESVILNKKDSSYISFGDIEVYVTIEDVILAQIILEKNIL